MAHMTDQQLGATLARAVGVINPILDLLAERDPLGLKPHTFDDGPHSGRLPQLRHLAAKVVNVTDWPGTGAWSQLSTAKRINWWINRVGAVSTIAVSYPGIFGAWTHALPLSSGLGFANQAIILTAVARESGVTERSQQTRLLAAVLCSRDLPATGGPPASPTTQPQRSRRSIVRGLFEVARILRAVNDTLAARPMPRKPFSTLSWIPLIGAPSLYVGERLALCRAAASGRNWIAEHPDAVSVSPPPAGSAAHRA
ncbi:MAG: hypothetical protein QM673_11515 [Gordonia sp. (in: high G+C Gram-positive bacteria)]